MRVSMPATVAVLLLVAGPAARGEKFAMVDQTCPVCAEKYQGRDYRLTDVHGNVVKGLLA